MDGFDGTVRAEPPGNAGVVSGWVCSPYCAAVTQTVSDRFQAAGRLLHIRFRVVACDAVKEAFRDAKSLNAEAGAGQFSSTP